MKDVSVRATEAVEIRRQLQSLGVLVVPENLEKLKHASNSFVKSGVSTTVLLKIPSSRSMRVRVSFLSSRDVKSGITLIQ
jgi:hypothetical protein